MRPPRKPVFNQVAIEEDRRARFNPLKDLTPDKLTTYLDEFRAGHLRNLALAMEAIEERDDVLSSVVPKAKAAVARHGWEINTVDTEDEADAFLARQQQEALEHFYNQLRVTSALDQDERGGTALLLRQMMDAKGKRYAIHNIVWQPDEQGRYTATAHFVPLWFFENTLGRMRFIKQSYGWIGEDLDAGAWLVTKGRGVMIACCIAWMYKHLPLRDWLIYSSRHGMPGIEGVTDAPEGSDEWSNLETAVTKAASEFAWVRNRSSEINTIQFAAQGELPYPKLIERMDRAMAAIWRGADLGTMSAGGGEGTGASLQGDESVLMEQDDAAWLTETVNHKLDRLVLDFTFGPDVPALAYFKILTAQRDTTDLDLRIDEFAVRSGHPISRVQFAERYNRPLPGAEDPLLAAPAADQGGGVIERMNAYGIGVRAGAITPTQRDEEQFRREAALPPMDGAARSAWRQDKIRRPITLAAASDPSAANEATLARRVADNLGVPETWLAPLRDWFADLDRKLSDTALSDDDLAAFLRAAAAKLPELFGEMDVPALADVFEAALGEAALQGVRAKLRDHLAQKN